MEGLNEIELHAFLWLLLLCSESEVSVWGGGKEDKGRLLVDLEKGGPGFTVM